MIELQKRIGRLVGIQKTEIKVMADGRQYMLVLYQAYDLYGWISPADNGLAVLFEGKIICQGLCKDADSYLGATGKQILAMEVLLEMDDDTFDEFLTKHDGYGV